MVNIASGSLNIQGGPNSGMTIPLSGRPVTLGRRSDNDVVVDETSVSRQHALVIATPNGFVLRDLNSTNGTFINRQRIAPGELQLKHGDSIRLGGSKVAFLFRQEGVATQQITVDSPATGAIIIQEPDLQQAPEAQSQEPQPAGKEADLLRFLESRKGTAVSREEIRGAVWPELLPGTAANQEIDKAVEGLLEHLEDDPRKPTHLMTVGEFGFLLM